MIVKKLPIGWIETKLGKFLKLKNGYAFKSKDFSESGIPVIRISNIKDKKVLTEHSAKVPKHLFNENFIVQEGDVLVAMSGATTGKYGIYNSEELALQNQRVGNLKPLSIDISKKFIYYLLGSLKETIEERAYGAAQPNISATMIENLDILLPPTTEQKRIVAKLDDLFGHLDSLNARMDRIPELLKNFRQQVLTRAVTGKLTEEWRKGKQLDEWVISNIGKLFDVKTGATPKRGTSKYYENATIPWIKSGLVRNEFIYEADEFITEKAIEETNAKKFPVGTLLVAMYGEGKTRGQVGWMKIEAATNQAIAALVNTEMELTTRSYIYYFCLSQYTEIRAKAEGGNQPNLNLTKIKNWQIHLPPEQEQKEIVKKVEELLKLADQAEASYHLLKERIDNLPQAILNKAFKGELVPQDPNDEPASVLLERIKNEREPKKTTKKRIGKKTSSSVPRQKSETKAKLKKASIKKPESKPAAVSIEENIIQELLNEFGRKQFTFEEIPRRITSNYEELRKALYLALDKKIQVSNKSLKMRLTRETLNFKFESS